MLYLDFSKTANNLNDKQRVIDELEKRGFELSIYGLDKSNFDEAKGVALYIDLIVSNEKYYILLTETMMNKKDERFSWVLHRTECNSEKEFFDNLDTILKK